MASTLDSVPDHHSPTERQPTTMPKLPYHQPDQYPSKVMLKILLNRLKLQAEEIIKEEQAGFRAGKSTTEQIFYLRIFCEKYLQSLYHVFVDFKNRSTKFCMQPCGKP